MKRSLIVAIALMSAMGIASPTLAESKTAINSQNTRKVLEISPFNLVNAAYQGRYINQGIPAAGRFKTSIHSNRIMAKDLVKAAIAQRRLSPKTLEDKSYIQNVQSLLDSLDRS